RGHLEVHEGQRLGHRAVRVDVDGPDAPAAHHHLAAQRLGTRGGGGQQIAADEGDAGDGAGADLEELPACRHRRALRRWGCAPRVAGPASIVARTGRCRQRPVASPTSPPAAATTSTTAQGGHRQTASTPKAARARATSAGPWMALVHTGRYSAARSRPTTAALIPRSADWHAGRARMASQNGRTPRRSRKDGRKIAPRASAAPATPVGGAL